MDKTKKQQMILIVLIPVFLISLLYMRSQQQSGKDVIGAGYYEEEPFQIAGLAEAITAQKTVFDSVYAPSGKDPFKDLLQLHLQDIQESDIQEIKPILPLPDLDIKGIIWNSDMPQAIVNDRIVRIGDTIAGVKIINIEKQGVSIDYNGESVLIKRGQTAGVKKKGTRIDDTENPV
jgi:hypothetical protein